MPTGENLVGFFLFWEAARKGAKGREKARKGARGCVRPRAAGVEIGLKKFFLRGRFAGLKSKWPNKIKGFWRFGLKLPHTGDPCLGCKAKPKSCIIVLSFGRIVDLRVQVVFPRAS